MFETLLLDTSVARPHLISRAACRQQRQPLSVVLIFAWLGELHSLLDSAAPEGRAWARSLKGLLCGIHRQEGTQRTCMQCSERLHGQCLCHHYACTGYLSCSCGWATHVQGTAAAPLHMPPVLVTAVCGVWKPPMLLQQQPCAGVERQIMHSTFNVQEPCRITQAARRCVLITHRDSLQIPSMHRRHAAYMRSKSTCTASLFINYPLRHALVWRKGFVNASAQLCSRIGDNCHTQMAWSQTFTP